MESLINEIIYDAKCGECGLFINNPQAWEEHICFMKKLQCPDCGSINIQPQGGCLVCLDCGWQSCG